MKKKLLFFTDLRGTNTQANVGNRSYIKRLSEKYEVTHSTEDTIYDFIISLNTNIIDTSYYNYIILQVGLFNCESDLSDEKIKILNNIFVKENISTKLYDISFIKEIVIPILKKISNLIWISHNNIIENNSYNGNKEIINTFSKLMCDQLENVINLHQWSNNEINRYTYDNMHLTSDGNDFIYTKLVNRIEKNILIVMGNGPSLKEIDFNFVKKYDTFGLNSAYKKYPDLSFYPTFFGCFDFIVCDYHKKSFSNLVLNSPIEKFFFLKKDYFSKQVQNHQKFQKLNFIYPRKHEKSESFDYFNDMGCSGPNATQAGILMGYKKIILIGCDANYVNYIDGAKKRGNTIIINKTPKKNPNYWFDDYQVMGDVYNVPNAIGCHIPAWNRINRFAIQCNVDIVNCSKISKIKCFRKSDINVELLNM